MISLEKLSVWLASCYIGSCSGLVLWLCQSNSHQIFYHIFLSLMPISVFYLLCNSRTPIVTLISAFCGFVTFYLDFVVCDVSPES